MFNRVSAKSILLGAVSAVALISVAHAADVVAPVQGTAGYNWSGLYVGFGGGAGGGVHDLTAGGTFALPFGRDGVFGELTVGYDYMVNERFLVGAYADARYGNIGFSLDVPGGSFKSEADYGFDVLARAGYLVTPQTLAYVLGGYSRQHFKISATGVGTFYDWSSNGYVLGLGMETVVHNNWTLKGEYRYSKYASNDLGSGGFISTDPSYHTFHVGLNYRLNGGATDAGFETPAYNWTGFYVGGALGAGSTKDKFGNFFGTGSFNGFGGDGVLGELSAGYDHDFGSWVAGVMVDGRYSGISSEVGSGFGLGFKVSADYGFDVLGRVGMKASESTLAYVLGGYSLQHMKLDVPSGGGGGPLPDWNSSGYSVGGGIESALTDKVAVNLEYRYSHFASKDVGGGTEITPSFQTVRLGLKYKFN
ncbi:outer membrane protein [Mesorhizobium sp. INR15]|uniref:outer membrane protein n=1 Tax=Mesorhizobium sp. INR15 TaxID=2654248 RepID=UPI0018965D67|nr:outer membrane beta-barrel protein [Mesorhizobium sp. INR15]QPC93179.1 outer membrane beta-barrel protein [Mesorhizobium sp. INR15]